MAHIPDGRPAQLMRKALYRIGLGLILPLPPTDPETLKRLLAECRAETLLGTPESINLDFKAEPYRLILDSQRFELAKDISAFANSEGGVLILGIKTTKDPTVSSDVAAELRPFPSTLIDVDQVRKVVADWVYPPPLDLSIELFPAGPDKAHVFGFVHVPAQPFSTKPFLVKRIFAENENLGGAVFGYFERRHSAALPASVQEVQAFMRDGMVLRSALDQRDMTIVSEVPPESTPQLGPAAKMVIDAASELVHAVGLGNSPTYVLTASPVEGLDASAMFRSTDHRIVELLSSPPTIRPQGFDLRTGQVPQIVRGEARRGLVAEYKALEFHRNGILVFAAPGHEDFLSWGDRDSAAALHINQIVVLESLYLFCQLAAELYRLCTPAPRFVSIGVQLLRMCVGNAPPILRPYASRSYVSRLDVKAAPHCDYFKFQEAQLGDLPGRAAFEAAARLYEWFGYEHDKIPYTEDTPTGTALSATKLANP